MKTSNKLPLSMQKKIAERLKDLRISAGYTQEDISKKIKVTTKTYREWEVGKYTKDDTFYYPAIEYDNLLYLSEIYGVSTDYLLCHSDCRSVDNHYISRKTGLSEQSINILSNRENGRDIIDSFISSQAYQEYEKNALYFLECDFDNFRKDVKRYLNFLKMDSETETIKDKKAFMVQVNYCEKDLEIWYSRIRSFGYKETFIFQKFLDEYKKQLATKYEYEEYCKLLKQE